MIKKMAEEKKPIVISCVNLKGGVGKTALSVNFAAYCGAQNLKTLLIDLDPQTNATFSCIPVDKWQKHSAEHGSVADLLGARSHTSAEGTKKEASEVIIKGVFKNVDLIPSHLDLFTVDLDLGSEVARETRLRRALKEIIGEYDIVICDCPPNLTIPTQNALATSTHYVVPVSPDFLSSLGVALLINRIKKLTEDLEHPISQAGIVISRVGRTSYFRQQTIEAIRKQFGDAVFQTVIKERTRVSEATAKNRPIFEMGDGEASAEFSGVSEELLEAVGLK